MPLSRVEGDERSDATVDVLVAAGDLELPLDDDQPGPFAYLMIAELLTGLEPDRDRACAVVRREHRGIGTTAGRLDLGEVPRLHGSSRYRVGTSGAAGRRPYTRGVPPVVDQLILGPLGTNCYLVRAHGGATEAIVVDPSGDAAEIGLALASLGARCVAILVTHSHFDHVLGLGELAEGTAAPVHAPRAELRVLEDPTPFTPAGLTVRPWTPEVLLDGDETLELAGITLEAVSVPGHSPGHLAFAVEGALLSGDVLFAGSVGRTDLPGADWQTLLDSIRRLVERFPPETVIHPGHGPATTLGAELARNPFLSELRGASEATR